MPTFRIAEKYREELTPYVDDEQRFDLVRSDAASRGDVGLKGTTRDVVLCAALPSPRPLTGHASVHAKLFSHRCLVRFSSKRLDLSRRIDVMVAGAYPVPLASRYRLTSQQLRARARAMMGR